MLNARNPKVRELLLHANVGLEKESLRVDANGRMARTRHPFSETEERITRDFCENQTEINTEVCKSAREAVQAVSRYTEQIRKTLSSLPVKEYLWPFSNPPYIEDEDDVPVAIFEGSRAAKTTYREYLANSYGRYKMAFSGVHFNFSFADELLEEDFKVGEYDDFQQYKNQLYLELAEKAAAYGWILTAATAASPLMDGSFFTKGLKDVDLFIGMGSVRCGDLGYWNHFAPILNYESIGEYAQSIRQYVDDGIIASPTELYYPVRLKPRGLNNLTTLENDGVNHIELRMFDLNPLVPEGFDERDALFAHLFLVFMASTPRLPFNHRAQVRAVQNFKNAARYDLQLVKTVFPNDAAYSLLNAGRVIVKQMKNFFDDASDEVKQCLDFQERKFVDQRTRYPYAVMEKFSGGFWKKGLQLAKERQAKYDV